MQPSLPHKPKLEQQNIVVHFYFKDKMYIKADGSIKNAAIVYEKDLPLDKIGNKVRLVSINYQDFDTRKSIPTARELLLDFKESELDDAKADLSKATTEQERETLLEKINLLSSEIESMKETSSDLGNQIEEIKLNVITLKDYIIKDIEGKIQNNPAHTFMVKYVVNGHGLPNDMYLYNSNPSNQKKVSLDEIREVVKMVNLELKQKYKDSINFKLTLSSCHALANQNVTTNLNSSIAVARLPNNIEQKERMTIENLKTNYANTNLVKLVGGVNYLSSIKGSDGVVASSKAKIAYSQNPIIIAK